MIEKGVSHIAYFRTDGGSSKLYTQEYVDEKDKEIERLNNIINELKRYIGNEYYCFDNESLEFKIAKDILDKLQELKGVDKE